MGWTNKPGPFTSVISSSCQLAAKILSVSPVTGLAFHAIEFHLGLLTPVLEVICCFLQDSLIFLSIKSASANLSVAFGTLSLFCTEVINKNWVGVGSRLILQELQQQPSS